MMKSIAGAALRGIDSVRRMLLKNKKGQQVFLFVRYNNALGICVHETTMEEALRKAHPECTIVVASAGLAVGTAECSPFVDIVVRTPDAYKNLRGAANALRLGLKKAGVIPTAVLFSLGNQRSTLVMLAAMVTPAKRYGYTQIPGSHEVETTLVPTDTHIANDLLVVELLSAQRVAMEPAVYFCERSLAEAKRLLSESTSERPRVAMVVETSRGQKTNWHPERFRDVTNAVIERGCVPVFLGTQQNVESIEQLRSQVLPGSISLAGKTDVPTLAAVLAMCDFCISLDTGTMHVARSADLPLVVLGPCWQKPAEWLPVAKANARILRGPDCESVPDNYLVDEVTVEQVLSAFDDLREKYPASEQARQARIASRLSHSIPDFI